MKIGILGGTFNPVHLGHLILAEEAREKLSLERIIFVPAFLPPHKEATGIAPAGARLAMLKAAIGKNKYFSVSDIEIRRSGRSYTIDTLKDFKEKFPADELYFIIGSDLLTYLAGWKDLKRILRMVKFIAATRPNFPLRRLPAQIATLPIRAVDISGFAIRSRIKAGKSFRYLVPEAVYRYISKNKLYQ